MNDPHRRLMRERLIAGVFLVIIAIFVGRLIQFQVFERDQWRRTALKQITLIKNEQPGRGEIRDRNGERLAVTRPLTYAVVYNRKPDHDLETMSRDLAPLLSMTVSDLRERMSSPGWVQLAPTVDAVIKEQMEAMYPKRFQFDEKPRRAYPGDSTAAVVIGFSDTDGKGLEGIELALDSILAGKKYQETRRVDAGRKRQISLSEPPLDSLGANVTLSLDLRLQTLIEEQLRQGLSGIRCDRACVLAVDPRTGDLLAVATTPSYNPNEPGKYPAQLRHCWPITNVYEPGSTLKIIPITQALGSGKWHRDSHVFCEHGVYHYRGGQLRDTHAYGTLTLDQILAYSSNIGAAKILMHFSPQEVYQLYQDFGFGTLTGVDLPGEVSGSILKPEKWSNSTQVTLAYGHGVSCTPLQVLMAYACIANDGILMRPRLILKAEFPNGETRQVAPALIRRVMSSDVADELKEMLANVVEYGTGTTVKVDGVRIAGKTGTARKVNPRGGYFENRYISSFAGFFPVDDPLCAMLVVVDDPRGEYYGSLVAGPIFKAIVEEMHNAGYLGGSRLRESERVKFAGGYAGHGEDRAPVASKSLSKSRTGKAAMVVNVKVPPEDIGKMVAMPNLVGWSVRPATEELTRRHLSCRVEGWRIVVEQSPAAGTLVPSGTVCELRALP